MSAVKNIAIPGFISGGLKYNSSAVLPTIPPQVSAGIYNVGDDSVMYSADQALTVTDTLLQSRQNLDTFCHYLVVMDRTGNKRIILYGEGPVSGATRNITSIASSGTIKTITFATGTLTGGTNKILVIRGNDGVNGVFKITGNATSTTATFESLSDQPFVS